ncbi:MAG: hypothetical protein HW419_1041 [Deltaproteobacteria bacterium]|nr:hypothetical protein [Deltaproteobacteria bacterium]
MEANVTTTAKQKIGQLKKQKAEIAATSPGREKIRRIQRKIRLLKRQTRDLAGVKKLAAAKVAAEAVAKEAAEKAAVAAAAAAAKAAEAAKVAEAAAAAKAAEAAEAAEATAAAKAAEAPAE